MTSNMEQITFSGGLRNFFKISKSTGQIKTPEQTTNIFLSIAEKGAFRSGDFMDYHNEKIEVNVKI